MGDSKAKAPGIELDCITPEGPNFRDPKSSVMVVNMFAPPVFQWETMFSVKLYYKQTCPDQGCWPHKYLLKDNTEQKGSQCLCLQDAR